MPLDKTCSLEAFKGNVRAMYKEGKTAKGTQHVAIALSTLKRACGVPDSTSGSPKDIVASASKGESAMFSNLMQFVAEDLAPSTTSKFRVVAHNKAQKIVAKDVKSMQAADDLAEKIIADQGDELTRVAVIVNGKDKVVWRRYADGTWGQMREEKVVRTVTREELKEQMIGLDGAITRNDPPVSSVVMLSPEQRSTLLSFVIEATPERHRFNDRLGRMHILYHDESGRAVDQAVDHLDDDQLVWLAQQKGWGQPLTPQLPHDMPEHTEPSACPKCGAEPWVNIDCTMCMSNSVQEGKELAPDDKAFLAALVGASSGGKLSKAQLDALSTKLDPRGLKLMQLVRLKLVKYDTKNENAFVTAGSKGPEMKGLVITKKGMSMAESLQEGIELSPADRKKVLMAVWKRYKSIGDGMMKGGKHLIYDAPKYQTHTLEDMTDEELVTFARAKGILTGRSVTQDQVA